MILNEFSYSKGRLMVMVNQLKKMYATGNQELNIAITYDDRILLTDDTFVTEGFMTIGYKEYQSLVEELGTEAVEVLTGAICTRIENYRGVKYQHWVNRQVQEIQQLEIPLKNAFVGDLEVDTSKYTFNHYRADKVLYLSVDRSLYLSVLFRGKSVLYRKGKGSKITYEEAFPVSDTGECEKSIVEVYLELVGSREE